MELEVFQSDLICNELQANPPMKLPLKHCFTGGTTSETLLTSADLLYNGPLPPKYVRTKMGPDPFLKRHPLSDSNNGDS